MLLARAGARVLLVDRAQFPSDTVSSHIIKQSGVAALERWGLLDAVLATGCPPIEECSYFVGERKLPLPLPPADLDELPIIAPRRTILDTLLVEAAADAGVDVHTGTGVSGLLRDGNQVRGIQAWSETSRLMRARAPIVIGADGKHSHIASEVGATYVHHQQPVSLVYYSYWSGCACDGIKLFFAPGRLAGLIPTHADQVLAFVQCRRVERHAFRSDMHSSYLEALASFPGIADVLDGATQEGPLRGMFDLPTYFRQAYGAGWALAGDAAHHKDPLAARGISDAFRDAELLAHAVASSHGGGADPTFALARYQAVREATSWEVSALNHRLAELPDDLDETQRRLFELLAVEARADTQLHEVQLQAAA
jgi:2-polyprenyl-6-methoxyphenol hydroxylase-like FAD-dependent oxidoreductase